MGELSSAALLRNQIAKLAFIQAELLVFNSQLVGASVVVMALVLLHVYDVAKTESENTNYAVTQLNAFGKWTGLGGIFHGGVEVYSKEWSYGYCEAGSGVYACTPRDNPMYKYRETVALGSTALSSSEVDKHLAQLKEKWEGCEYDLLNRNCNHFCAELADVLKVEKLPVWLNRMADGADALANFSSKTAEQARWLGTTTSSWFSGLYATNGATNGANGTPENGASPQPSPQPSPSRPIVERAGPSK